MEHRRQIWDRSEEKHGLRLTVLGVQCGAGAQAAWGAGLKPEDGAVGEPEGQRGGGTSSELPFWILKFFHLYCSLLYLKALIVLLEKPWRES